MSESIEIKCSTIKYKSVDSVGENEQKTKIDQYLGRYQREMLHIVTNIELLKRIRDYHSDIQILFNYAPRFMRTVLSDMWICTVVGLGSILRNSNKEETNIFLFLDSIEREQSKIFTREFYRCSIPQVCHIQESDLNWIKIEKEPIAAMISQCRELLESQACNIGKLITLRDKLYAHYDKVSLKEDFRKRIQNDVTIEMLECLASVVEQIFNIIHLRYRNSTFCLTPIDCSDISALEFAVQRYDRNRMEILETEHKRNSAQQNLQ